MKFTEERHGLPAEGVTLSGTYELSRNRKWTGLWRDPVKGRRRGKIGILLINLSGKRTEKGVILAPFLVYLYQFRGQIY